MPNTVKKEEKDMKAIDGKIYLARNKENGKCYVGQTIRPLKERVWEHAKTDGCPVFHNAIIKYGLDAFDIVEIDYSDNMNDMNALEEMYIKQYNCMVPNGYNLATGGGQSFPSDETREKLRQVCANRSDEIKQKIIEAGRQANTGRKMPAEAVEKSRQAKIGKKRSPDTIEKMRQAKLGKKMGPRSEEWKRKIGEGNKKRWAKKRAELAEIAEEQK